MNTLQLPLAFREQPDWPKGEPAPAVGYLVTPYRSEHGQKTQPVLSGRKLISPLIDLNSYACRAEIDWIEIRITTPNFHQAVNMQRAVATWLVNEGSQMTIFVTGPDRKRGYKGKEFILKFQQPNPREFTRVLNYVACKYGLNPARLGEFKIMGVEVSVDFYVKVQDMLDDRQINLKRWLMVDLLRRHLKPAPELTEMEDGGPRFFGDVYGRGGATRFVNPSISDLRPNLLLLASRVGLDPSDLVTLDINKHSQPTVDTTSWIGPKDFHVMLRTMDKVTDKRDPHSSTYRELPMSERRARLEVTLQGKIDENGGQGAVGLEYLADLKRFQFKSLRRAVFEFFLPTFGEHCDGETIGVSLRANEEEVFRRSGVYGLDRFHRTVQMVNQARIAKGEQGVATVKLGKKGRLLSWMDMNQKIDRALKKLGKDWEALL